MTAIDATPAAVAAGLMGFLKGAACVFGGSLHRQH
jgi:hypothetical protein